MFFMKKKKEELSDQTAVYQERAAPRWGKPSYNLKAGISFSGFEGEGQLGNVSISGVSMLSVTYVNMVPDKIYQAKITPDREDHLEPFNINLKLNWTKSSETLFMAGFSIDGDTGIVQLKRYIDVLRSKGIPPDFGNMDDPHHH